MTILFLRKKIATRYVTEKITTLTKFKISRVLYNIETDYKFCVCIFKVIFVLSYDINIPYFYYV